MTRCGHTLGDSTGLLCTRAEHEGNGHTYEASWSPDIPRDEETDR